MRRWRVSARRFPAQSRRRRNVGCGSWRCHDHRPPGTGHRGQGSGVRGQGTVGAQFAVLGSELEVGTSILVDEDRHVVVAEPRWRFDEMVIADDVPIETRRCHPSTAMRLRGCASPACSTSSSAGRATRSSRHSHCPTRLEKELWRGRYIASRLTDHSACITLLLWRRSTRVTPRRVIKGAFSGR